MRGLYVHIPFCTSICTYCDFYKRIPKDEEMINSYLDRLKEDLSQYKKYFSSVKTIYIGGGTPSILSENNLEKLLQMLSFFKDIEEYTLEANPESLNKEKIKILTKYSVNRVSLGVQSFDEKSLKTLGRKHNKDDVFNVISALKEEGINNINVDLIFAIPNTSLNDVKRDLNIFYQLDIPHISYYSLILEEKTVLKHFNIAQNEEEDIMYEYIISDLAKHNYKQYEISNFTLDKESIHNKVYWQNKEYIGIGAGASGYLDGVRYQNEHLIVNYLKNFVKEKEVIDESEKLKEEMILGLRLCKGVNIKEIEEKYNIDLSKKYPQIEEYISKGYLIKDDYLRLSKKGTMLANEVFMIFI